MALFISSLKSEFYYLIFLASALASTKGLMSFSNALSDSTIYVGVGVLPWAFDMVYFIF